MLKTLLAGTLALTAVAASQVPAVAQPNQCFFIRDWQGWKAPDDHTIFIRINNRDIYRLDVEGACPELTWPGARLISRNHAGSICSPLDFDLKVSLQDGPSTPCIVRHMTRLSPEEAASIPPRFRP